MKRLGFACFAIALCALMPVMAPAQELIFEDTFEELNPQVWRVDGAWPPLESSFFLPPYVEDGVLKFTSDPPTTEVTGQEITTGLTVYTVSLETGRVVDREDDVTRVRTWYKDFTPILNSNSTASTGIFTFEKILTGDFELTTLIDDFVVENPQAIELPWYASFRVRVENEVGWDRGTHLYFEITQNSDMISGNVENVYYALQLFKRTDGQSEIVAWDTILQPRKSENKLNMIRVGNHLTVYFNGKLFGEIDGVPTEDLYLTLNGNAWNETAGSVATYSVKVPEVVVMAVQ